MPLKILIWTASSPSIFNILFGSLILLIKTNQNRDDENLPVWNLTYKIYLTVPSVLIVRNLQDIIFSSHWQVNAGLECGIGVEDFDNWVEGDVLEFFNTVQKKRTLEEASASMTAAIEEAGIKM